MGSNPTLSVPYANAEGNCADHDALISWFDKGVLCFTPTKKQCECNSAVEYLVANENVEGSNPFVRSFPSIGITVKPAW